MPERKLSAILRGLCENCIDFIVVGGVAAVLHGAPIQTYDLDVVYSRAPENIDRLLKFLGDVDAIFRTQPDRRLRPKASHLEGSGHLNLLTRFGPLDLLAHIGSDLTYNESLPRAVEMDVGEGLRVRVLDLETIIAIKEGLASEKDLAALPILRRTLRELNKDRDA